LHKRKLIAGAAVVCVAASGTGVALAARSHSAVTFPNRVTVNEAQNLVVKPNRYIQDGLRWARDVYRVKSGGTLHIVNNKASEGPHTFTIVRPRDEPKTGAQVNNCKICEKLGQAHGADPNSDAPPKFPFLENGVGQATPPSVDRPGDSGVTGEGKQGEFINLKVTAKRGTTLHFMCLIHPWMQARVIVG
jgi:hypothetical protein